MGEHRFAEKDAVEDDSVETPHKLAVAPCLYRMGEARIMQLAVSVDYRRRDPRARLTSAQRCCAVFDDIAKRSVDSHVEFVSPDPLVQRMGNTELGAIQHHPRVGTPPQNRLARPEPGKNAATIRGQYPVG